ncbi:MAG: PAS domain S-box protein [Proteobacteria bacterium]|nr:PAS domain S-box protein [Pseudomonadota bacterium]
MSESIGVNEILIVDDTTANLQLLYEILDSAGYTVRPASDGQTALRSAKAKAPGIILLEIKMDGMDGFEVCRQLKADPKTCSIPIIFISVLGEEHEKIKGFQAGAVDFITKPFYAEEVLARVKTHLSIQQLQMDLKDQSSQLLLEIQEHERTEKALFAEKERLAVTLRSIGDAVITTDIHGNVAYLNPVAEQLTGWQQDEASGKPLPEVFQIINEQTREVCPDPVENVLQTGSVVGLANHTVLIARDGTEYPIADSGAPIRNDHGEILGVVMVFRDKTKEHADQQSIERQQQLLTSIAQGQAHFIAADTAAKVFDQILENLLAITDSQYGFIGEVLYSSEDQPYLKTHSVTNIAWNEETRNFYDQNAPEGLEFRNLQTLFGAALISGEPIIANDPLNDSRRGGLPDGHPSLQAFLGIPLHLGGRMLAMVGLANRPGGYDQELLDFLKPFLVSVAQLAEAFRHRSEAKRTNEILKENEIRYRTIFDNSCEGIILQDASGKIITWNKAAERVFGISEEEVASHTSTSREWNTMREDGSAFPGSEHPSMVTLATGKPCNNVVMGVKNASGAIAWISINTNPLFTEDMAMPSGVVITFSDITELKQAEMSAFDAAKDWQFTFDAISSAIWILDSRQRIVRANKAAEQLCRRADGQMLGQQCWTLAHGTDCPIDGCPLLRAKESLLRETMDLQLGEGWFEVAVDPIFDSTGRFSGAVHIISDISERKQAEESLRESEDKFKHIFDYSAAGKSITRPTGEIEVNHALCEMLGYSKVELSDCKWQDITYLDDIEFTENEVQSLLSGVKTATRFTKRYLHKNGAIVWADVSTSLRRDKDGKPQYFITTINDITEQKILENQAATLQAQLQQAQKMESVGRLAGGVAHDFNNLLSIILGYGEMIQAKTKSGEDLHECAREIIDAGVRSANITRQLLAFARKQTIAPVVLDLNEAVKDTAKMLRRLIGEDIDLTWLPKNGLWPVLIDPAQLDQLLANLCVNARDAIKGVGRVTIETDMAILDAAYCADHPGSIAGEYVVLTVSDDGCGMDSDTVGKIFEPFFTTKAIGQGTGLGLAMVYGIVKQNGGFINVYSEPGKGTTFKIYLARHDDPAFEAEKKNQVGTPYGQGQTILIVEDEISILKLAKRMLEDLGYKVFTAAMPGQALRLAEDHPGTIDLLLTDVVMPEMDGKELAQKLTKLRPGLKIVFMSGYTANAIAHHGILEKGTFFIQKPFTRASMALKVKEALEI